MSTLSETKFLGALRALLRPVAALCLKRGLFLNDLIEAAKGAFVDAATTQLQQTGTKSNSSRLSIMTGVHRADVKRIQEASESSSPKDVNIVRRVIGRWVTDPKLADSNHQPLSLGFGSPESEFSKLCETISKTAHPPAVLFELERTGRVRRTNGRIELVKQVEQVGKNEEQAFQLLAHDVQTLISAVTQNIATPKLAKNMHFSTEYDQVFARNEGEIREWIVEKGREFHRDLRAFLAARDAELNPDFVTPGEDYLRVSVHSVSLIEHPLKQLRQEGPKQDR
jgi:hypothetical protein